jgi:hypothetical protein
MIEVNGLQYRGAVTSGVGTKRRSFGFSFMPGMGGAADLIVNRSNERDEVELGGRHQLTCGARNFPLYRLTIPFPKLRRSYVGFLQKSEKKLIGIR